MSASSMIRFEGERWIVHGCGDGSTPRLHMGGSHSTSYRMPAERIVFALVSHAHTPLDEALQGMQRPTRAAYSRPSPSPHREETPPRCSPPVSARDTLGLIPKLIRGGVRARVQPGVRIRMQSKWQGAPRSRRRKHPFEAQEQLSTIQWMADHQMDGKTCERGRAEVGDEGKWTVQVMDGWMEGGLEENASDAMGRDMPPAEETGWMRKEGEEFLMRRRRAQAANQAGCRAMEMGAPAVAATIFDVAMQAGCNKVERSEFQVNRKRDQKGATRIAGTGHPQARPTLVPAHARDKGKGKVGEDEMYRIPSPPDDGLKNEPKRVSALEDDALKVYYNAGLARLTAGDPLGAICAFRCAKKSWEGDPCFWIRVAEAYLEISDACIDSRSQLPPRRVQLVLGCQSEASFGMEAASHAADCLHRASLLLQHPYPAAVPGTAFYAQVDSAKVQSHVLMKLAYANLRIGATRAAVSYACQLLEMKDCPVTYQGLATLYWAESLATEEDFAAAHKVLSESLDSRQLSATLDKDTLSALKARLLDLEKLNACGPQPAAPSPLGAQPEVY